MNKSQKFPKNTSSYDESNGVKFFFSNIRSFTLRACEVKPKKMPAHKAHRAGI